MTVRKDDDSNNSLDFEESYVLISRRSLLRQYTSSYSYTFASAVTPKLVPSRGGRLRVGTEELLVTFLDLYNTL